MKKLILQLLMIGLSFSQTYETVFTDDFEDGNAYNWESESGWEVVFDNNNYVYQGTGHKWTITPTQYTSNTKYSGKFRIFNESFHLNFLKQSTRHFFSLSEDQLEVYINDDFVESKTVNVKYQQWHSFLVETKEDSIKISIDGIVIGQYQDLNASTIKAKLAFECLDNTTVQFDDILVEREKVIYEQNAKWVKTGGPIGGIGYDVRIDPENPNIIYVTDNWAGIHKSYDGGNSWIQKIDGIYSRTGSTNDAIPMFCLTIDHNDPNILWAGTFGMRGVFKSIDKGESWEFSGTGIENVEQITTRNFCITPGNSDIVFLGVEWSLFDEEAEALGLPSGVAKGKIYRTKDGGKNWEEVLFCDALVRTIIVDPNNTNIVYAATGIFDRDHVAGCGVYKSTDGGDTWEQINNGIKNLTVGDIEMHPTNSNILLAATGRLSGFSREANSENGEILRTEDGGKTWTEMKINFDDAEADDFTLFTYIEWDESDHNIVYAAASDRGFYKSTDGGKTFSTTSYNPPKINSGHIISVATHKDRPGTVFANSYGGGVFISEDYTKSWKDASRGYTGCEITDLAISGTDPEFLVSVSRTGTAATEDGGTSWNGVEWIWEFKNVPLGNLEKRSVAIHPTNNNTYLTGDGDGIFLKEIGQEKFLRVFTLEEHFTTEEIVTQTISYAPSNPDVIYAGIAKYGSYQIDRPDEFDPSNIADGIIKSTDGGKTWTTGLNTGLENTKLNIMNIAVHPQNENLVFAATLNDGLYKSNDGAQNWGKSSSGITSKDIRSIAIDKNNPDVIYVGTQRGGLYKSIDAGNNFVKLSNGLESEGAYRDIQIDPTNSNRVYAADWLSGVYLSEDSGANWRIINEDLSTRAVQRLAVSHDGVYVYAGTQGEGVFRMTTKNKGPVLRFASPDNSNPISLSTNVDVEFLVSAYDFNGDEITFEWYVDGSKIDTLTTTSMTVNSEKLGNGSHTVNCKISDGVNDPLDIEWILSINIVGIEKEIPLKYNLSQNYPNPFNPTTTIDYEVAKESNVLIEVFNVLGQKVKTLVYKEQAVGTYKIKFDGTGLSSGVYFVRMKSEGFVKHKKMMLVK